MNLSDAIANKITADTVNLLRFAESLRGTILNDLAELEAELVRDIEVALGKRATAFTMERLNALLKQTRETIATAYNGISADTQEAAIRLAKLLMTQTATAVNSVIGVPLVTVALSKQQIEAIATDLLVFGKKPWEWWSAQDARLRDVFAREMRMGLYRGETVDQLVRRVRGTRANGFTDGIMQASRSQAEALVRTSVMTVAGEARQRLFAANRDVIKGVQWVSTLDSRTTEICIALDGKQWEFPDEGDDYADYKPIGHNKEFSPPPAHWNCRSAIIPITFSWEELAGRHGNSDAARAADQIDDGTRATMDGQVAAKTTFEAWLREQTEAFQNEVLGPGKARLWREGTITLSQLTDIRNNPLTLAQLEAKYA